MITPTSMTKPGSLQRSPKAYLQHSLRLIAAFKRAIGHPDLSPTAKAQLQAGLRVQQKLHQKAFKTANRRNPKPAAS